MKKKKKSLSDIDGDGVPNTKDCNMFDKDKQDYNPNIRIPSIKKSKNTPLTLYKGVPVSKWNYTPGKGYTTTDALLKRAQKRSPKWNKKPKWLKGI